VQPLDNRAPGSGGRPG